MAEADARDVAALLAGVPDARPVRREGAGWAVGADERRALVVHFEKLAARLAVPASGAPYPEGDRAAAATAQYAIERPGEPTPEAAALAATVAAAIAEAAGGVVHDPSAGVLLLPKEARAIAAGARADGFVRVHLVEGPDGVWLHTHGAAKLGLPEIEAFGLDPALGAVAANAATALLSSWMGGGVPAEVALPHGRARVAASADGAARPTWARCGGEVRRVILLDPETGSDVSPALGGRASGVREVERAVLERARALAELAIIAPLVAAQGGALPPGVRAFVKVAIERGAEVEVAWVEVDRVRADGLMARGADLDIDQALGLAVFEGERLLPASELSRVFVG